MQPYTTQFVLSKEYLGECFDESKAYNKSARPNFVFPLMMLSLGIFALMWTDQPKSLGLFILALGLIELLHIRYKRAWWLTRQMIGRTGGRQVTLSLDEQGIETRSGNTITNINWTDVSSLVETERGLILVTAKGAQQYLSKSIFSEEVVLDIIRVGNARSHHSDSEASHE
ncbi:YcxB family protein [uncultured Umboniibacter sp.]|uniref:YcxB family protein n=1 Tax=uncultured Umboniibacter sp. TaxID=1798917 RepID=UPI00261685AF|nr:YcxB family protein [uncultured Umboniibacter sp.]